MPEKYYNYNLDFCRQQPSERIPAAHQLEALDKLQHWFKQKHSDKAGGLLVLPTGGGKTFTTIRFLCTYPLSEGYKILWLAHTHHLLEQAFCSFASEVNNIAEPKEKLAVRIVSGLKFHCSIEDIRSRDDVLISTIQTIIRAYQQKQPELEAFLKSANEKLFIIFDEAHHSPAPTYYKLIDNLQSRFPKMYLLGLTATPVYRHEEGARLFEKLFPQKIIYQVSPQRLIANGILAQPELEQHNTNVEISNSEKWNNPNLIDEFLDIPNEIIEHLANNKIRNRLIAEIYANNQNRYKKTIIFVDRWIQCDQIMVSLRERGIKADVIYYHQSSDKNKAALESFRCNEIDVLINVLMLTEGTDIPDVQTVFLTRATNSSILLNQMIGRALRGPSVGGTEKAYIVAFIDEDEWKQKINWSGYQDISAINLYEKDCLEEESSISATNKISELLSKKIRLLAQEMDREIEILSFPEFFLSLLPIGWYRVTFEQFIHEKQKITYITELVMVFEDHSNLYKTFIDKLIDIKEINIEEFANPNIYLEDCQDKIIEYYLKIFSAFIDFRQKFNLSVEGQINKDLLVNLFYIIRHIAQHNRKAPPFFDFEQRDDHNLNNLAKNLTENNYDPFTLDSFLQAEFNREDRYWKSFYQNYELFKSHYTAYSNQIAKECNKPRTNLNLISNCQQVEKIKNEVKNRDKCCLCCGSEYPLLVYPIVESRETNFLNNWQTLCHECAGHPELPQKVSFLNHQTFLTKPPADFSKVMMPESANEMRLWEYFWHRSVNFLYHCAAVENFQALSSGWRTYWIILLYPENDPAWLKPYMRQLMSNIQDILHRTGYIGPEMILINDGRIGAKQKQYYGKGHLQAGLFHSKKCQNML